jgi:hypothetical protein
MKKLLLLLSLSFILSCEKEEEGVPCDSTHTIRIGAMCNDGTRSNSTGSGTCSSHGGVNYWICKR